MQGLYVPNILNNQSWPETVKKDFTTQLHRFMAFVTDTNQHQKGSTVLYVPQEKIDDIEEASKSKDLVQRLEASVVHWTRQIKEVINSQQATTSSDTTGLVEEVQFWRGRCDDFFGITEQLDRPEVHKIIEVLKFCRSGYLDPFLRLSNLIQDGSQQSESNLKFLSLLLEPCKEVFI